MLRQCLTREIITAVAVTGESAMLKFKDTTETRHEAACAVRAVLNQSGGQVLFGMTRYGDVVGQ